VIAALAIALAAVGAGIGTSPGTNRHAKATCPICGTN